MDILTGDELRQYGCDTGGTDTTGKLNPKGVSAAGMQRMSEEARWIEEFRQTGDKALLLKRWREKLWPRIVFGKKVKSHFIRIPVNISKAIGYESQVHAVLAKDGTLTRIKKVKGQPKQLVEVLMPAFK